MINIIAPNLPLAQSWATQHNYRSFIYVTDEKQIRREFRTIVLSGRLSKEKQRLLEEVTACHKRIEYVDV